MKLTRRVLSHVAKSVDFQYPYRNKQLEEQLYQYMTKQHGIGLAAPQVGISMRLFVMQVDSWSRACYNPEIIDSSQDLEQFDEGCLSFPGEHCVVSRPRWVDVRYQDFQGAWHSERLGGLLGRCFQHELDHLNGITMWDRHREQNAKQP